MDDDMTRRVVAEFFGTFWLVLGGCGGRSFWRLAFLPLGLAFSVSLFAFGLTVLTMAYAVGHISGGHFQSGGHDWLVERRALPQPSGHPPTSSRK